MATAKDRLAASVAGRLFESMGESHQVNGQAVTVLLPPETLEADESGIYWRRVEMTVLAADLAPPKPNSLVNLDGEDWTVLNRSVLDNVVTVTMYRAAS